MGNGDGPAIRPKWQVPCICRVHVPFRLNGERAIVTSLKATWPGYDSHKSCIDVRVDYPDRPHGEQWTEGCPPAGDAFYIEPCRYYSEDDLIKAIQAQQKSRETAVRKRERAEALREAVLMNKRIEVDSIVSQIAYDLGEER